MSQLDEQLTKVAQATGVEPLAHAFNVKLSDAQAQLDAVRWDGYFETMAKLGHVARTPQEEENLAALAQLVAMKHSRELQAQANAQRDRYQNEISKLSAHLGVQSPEASAAYEADIRDSADKLAQLTFDPQTIQLMLSLNDANSILSSVN